MSARVAERVVSRSSQKRTLLSLIHISFALGNGDADALALDGLALTDYGFEVNYAALEKLLATATDATMVRGLFAGCDLLTGGDAYRQARKFPRCV